MIRSVSPLRLLRAGPKPEKRHRREEMVGARGICPLWVSRGPKLLARSG
jgi:hypothetical protein